MVRADDHIYCIIHPFLDAHILIARKFTRLYINLQKKMEKV